MSEDKKNEVEISMAALKAVKSLISTIAYAKTPEELSFLKRSAESLIAGISHIDPSLGDMLDTQLDSAEDKVEGKISKDQIKRVDTSNKDVKNLEEELGIKAPDMSKVDNIYRDELLDLSRVAVGAAAIASMISISEELNKEKHDFHDTALGPVIEAMQEKHKTQEHRKDSSKRISGLLALSEAMNTDNVADLAKEALIEKASEFKIKFIKAEDGHLKVDEKGKKILNNIASNIDEIEKKREERKKRDLEYDEDRGYEVFSGFASMFGIDVDDISPEPAVKSQSVSRDKNLLQEIPETVRDNSPVISYEASYNPNVSSAKIINTQKPLEYSEKILYETKQKEMKKGKSSGRAI
jgi:hypothetical protein